MKKSIKKRSKQQGIRKTQLRAQSKNKKPERIKPVLYTRRLKSNKQKKLKQVNLPLWSDAQKVNVDLDPADDDEQKAPSSFREMMRCINVTKNRRNPYRYSSNEGDTTGMRKCPEEIPKQGKKETPEDYARRMDRCVQSELLKLNLAKKDNAPLVDHETFKSVKTKKALKRLKEKKKRKKMFALQKRLTGFEHLKDNVEFGEVVHGPPVLKTMPKKVGGSKTQLHNLNLSLDQKLAT